MLSPKKMAVRRQGFRASDTLDATVSSASATYEYQIET